MFMCLHVRRFTVVLFAYIFIADRRRALLIQEMALGQDWSKRLVQTVQGLRYLRRYIVTSVQV